MSDNHPNDQLSGADSIVNPGNQNRTHFLGKDVWKKTEQRDSCQLLGLVSLRTGMLEADKHVCMGKSKTVYKR